MNDKIGSTYLLVMSIIICFILIFYFATLKIDLSSYLSYVAKLTADSTNSVLVDLLNANTLGNLPNVTIESNNNDINNLINCKEKIQYIGEIDESKMSNYRDNCKNKCGAAGELLIIEPGQEYIENDVILESGVYCSLAPVKCNLETGYVLATVNSKTCRTKYPSLFGGDTASTIVACNNEKYPSTGSILWDYLNNEAVNPFKVLLAHEDETLPDGSYRFRCKYNETKDGNPFIPHPLDRFQPLVDPCNATITRASYSVHANVGTNSWSCDCGDFSETRVKHLDSSNPKSTCTSCYYEKNNDEYKIPYICFNKNSNYKTPLEYQPALTYSTTGNMCDSLKINFKKYTNTEMITNDTDLGNDTKPYLSIITPDGIDDSVVSYWENVH